MPACRAFLLAIPCGVLALASLAQPPSANKETTPMHHAHGIFTVKTGAPSAGPADGLSRFTMTKEIHGGLEGTSQGEMIAGGSYQAGTAGYVAMEVVTGTLDGRRGSFALQHTATMKGPASDMTIVVTPGSGTGALAGLAGAFKITIKDGQHFYDLDYTLPEK